MIEIFLKVNKITNTVHHKRIHIHLDSLCLNKNLGKQLPILIEIIAVLKWLYNSSFKDYDEVNILLEGHARLIEELKRVQPSHKKDLSLIANQALREIRSGANLTKFGMPQLDWVAGGMSKGDFRTRLSTLLDEFNKN